MKKVFIVLIVLLVIASSSLLFRQQTESAYQKLFYYSRCDTPITYKIGTIDPQFEIDHDELLADTKESVAIWNNAIGKQLFMYDPNSTFTVNMVYDDRQRLTRSISDLNNNLEQKQNEIDPKIEEFEKRRATFEQKLQDLNNRIRDWNEKGGAPKDEYEKLVNEQQTLQKEAADLNAIADELGQSTKEYNSDAQRLNQTINNYREVLEYKPEEGLYEQEGRVRKISIYIDVDETEFLHTLTHEFGHALGLDHSKNPQAIMFAQTNSVLTPAPDDINALQEVCRKRSVAEIAGERMRLIVEILQERIASFQSTN